MDIEAGAAIPTEFVVNVLPSGTPFLAKRLEIQMDDKLKKKQKSVLVRCWTHCQTSFNAFAIDSIHL